MIDVAISSCGRTDILEQTIKSFHKYIKFSGKFRFVIVEDFLEKKDQGRIEERDAWLKSHASWFDTIKFNDQKAGYVHAYRDILPLLKSQLFFRLDDDTPFLEIIDIDPIIEYLNMSDDVCQVIFRRQGHKLLGRKFINIGKPSRQLTINPFYSVSTGIHKLDWANKIVNTAYGVCHESSVLTPIMQKLGQTSAVANGISQRISTDDVGTKLGYVKGKWK